MTTLDMIKPSAIPQQPQYQGPLSVQLEALVDWANRLGFYDAADLLTQQQRVSQEGSGQALQGWAKP